MDLKRAAVLALCSSFLMSCEATREFVKVTSEVGAAQEAVRTQLSHRHVYARLAYATYASRSTLNAVDVVFVVQKENALTEEYGEDHNQFDVSELGAPSADRGTPPAKK